MRAATRTLAGLEAGVMGSFAVICWFLLHSWVRGEYWWSKFNVLAAVFFGNRVFQAGLSVETLVGFCEIVLLYGVAGIAASWVLPLRSGRLMRFVGAILFAAALHWVLQMFGWRRFNPFAPSYFVPAATVPAHFLFALVLLRLPGTLRAVNDRAALPPYSRETMLQ